MGDGVQDPTSARKIRKLSHWAAIWKNRGGQFKRLSIKVDSGAASCSEVGAWALAHHWQPILDEAPVNLVVARKHLAEFIVPIHAQDEDYVMSFDEFVERVMGRSDTGPGPDGVLYSLWRAAPPQMVEVLFGAYFSLLSGVSPHDEFNHALVSFLPKGTDDADDLCACARDPKDTRPLSQSNTDAKMVAGGILHPLHKLLAPRFSLQQRGGVSGLAMTDNILDVECKALQFAIANNSLGGIVCFDIRTAFPAIARPYLFWVLKVAGIPRFIRKAIEALYRRNSHTIVLNGRVYMAIDVRSGVKQGCPLSMLLFCFAIDPIIRYMVSRLSPGCMLRACCDDIAIATANLTEALCALRRPFRVAVLAANLWLAPHKIQCLALGEDGQHHVEDLLGTRLKYVRGMKFVDAVKYLGVLIGPGAVSLQWSETIRKFELAVREVCGLNAGLGASIAIYNFAAHSKLVWLGALVAPDARVVASEFHALQKITRGPWGKLPLEMLANLRDLGLPANARLITLASLAGRARTALKCDYFMSNIASLRQARLDDDAALLPRHHVWLDHSIHAGLMDALSHPSCEPVVRSNRAQLVGNIQKELYLKLHVDLFPFSFKSLLEKRYLSWVGQQHFAAARAKAAQAAEFFERVKPQLKPAHLAIIVKTRLDAWCVSSNFGQPVGSCFFCGQHGDESLHHFATCPALIDAWRRSMNSVDSPRLSWLFIPSPIPGVDSCVVVALHVVVVYNLFNYIRTSGRRYNFNMYLSFFRAAVADSVSIRRALPHRSVMQMSSE